jgi:hypothetical protein
MTANNHTFLLFGFPPCFAGVLALSFFFFGAIVMFYDVLIDVFKK